MQIYVKYTFFADHLEHLGKKSLISPQNLAQAPLPCDPRLCTGSGSALPPPCWFFFPSQLGQGRLLEVFCSMLGLLADLKGGGLQKGGYRWSPG